MKLSPQWLREFVDPKVDNLRLAQDLTAVGIAVEGISGKAENAIFEMEIGTNRPDAMNHYGVAREASVIYNLPLRPLAAKLPAAEGSENFTIEIADPSGCARYTSRILRDVSINPSPAAIAARLTLVDQRSINNAADATNYTLWEMGHPTHVFDLDLLEGCKILVRRAFSGETLKTLDGVERKLTPDDLVIADAKKPVALAGVMGGFDTMITSKTRNILIEAAWFDPSTVRKTSRRFGLHTDASHRFERGADFEATALACDRVAALILDSAGGRLSGSRIDTVARHVDLAPVALHLSEVHRILGGKLETNEIFRILKQLGFEMMPERGGDPDFTVRIPSWRLDVEREIDLVEEIARMHGYDKFTNTLPAYAGAVVEPPGAEKDSKLRSSLLALGYNEAVSLTFISHQDAELFSSSPVVELANPQSEEASVMRSSLVPGMLNMLAYNLNRGAGNVRLFEAGSIFETAGAATIEPKRICLGWANPGSTQQFSSGWGTRDGGFFELKGDVENLLHAFQHESLTFDAQTADYYHRGRSARALLDDVAVAEFGQIDSEIAAARKLRHDVLIAEFDLERLYQHGLRVVRYEPLPRYPAVERDFSFVFDDAVAFEKIYRTVTALGLKELRTFAPVEVFRGGNVPPGRYSMLLRATFQSYERTLREDEVAEWSAHIVKALEGLGGKLRT
ncbi:MAG TPA: phenylalanine--tRNA ligase subunit beta [Terriglobales bacterium]|jgi:phenylalanyl-tRNA synthetase beta chain|nr:phenylalanine--tRNA ligase subunit beta [Terriglobales bacterium]